MRTSIFTVIILVLFISPISDDLLADEALEGRPLTGVYVGNETPARSLPGMDEGAAEPESGVSSPSFADLPVVSEGLRAAMAKMNFSDSIRVIVWLKYQPQDVIGKRVREKYVEELKSIRQRIWALNNGYARQRTLDAPGDSANYLDPALTMSMEDRQALRTLNEEHETLSLVVRNEIADQLRKEVEADQASVRSSLERMGATVEYGVVSVNALVARLPVMAVDRAASIDKVARICEDVSYDRCLTNIDNATRASDPGGLWDNGETGGIYDPAVLDTGIDRFHSGLVDNAGRTNFYSWYLVGAYEDPDWYDVTSEDDWHGHGTHVMGIVASHGDDFYPQWLGLAHGAEKVVTLKAGYNDIWDQSHMVATDAMWVVDRALYDTAGLRPFGTFNDDVDGLNMSFGGPSAYDISYFSLFLDAIISTYPDLLMTISAGNEGPSNPYFNDPAFAYNPLAVANVDDQGTAFRSDDEIHYTSSRGPTAIGRRKPDIAAPGTDIQSCNNEWETDVRYINQSGTSMSSPAVQGVAMDLMDAGVFDELEIKALLINTAQKNDGAIDFESDADGWDEAYGWGYMNALAAYHHRTDLFSGTVTPYPNAGHYHLYKGQMRDEGSGAYLEGRDRATMAWNLHVTYVPHDFPTTWYDLSNLNLYLFEEADNTLHDYDVSAIDNVAQVRIDAGAGTTDVIINALAFDTVFDHGGPDEEFALATEEGFVEVSIPANFLAFAGWPSEMEPNEEADFTFYIGNYSEIASHNNLYNLQLPPGWSLVSGGDPWSAGSAAGGGGLLPSVTWRLRAQPTEEENVQVTVDHSHYSYYVEWGDQGWSLPVNVRQDTTPPSPAPGWVTPPTATSTNSITMSCTESSDEHAPVSYYFDYYYSPTGGAGGTDSGWTSNRFHIDGGLAVNHCYGYRVQARDDAVIPNATGYNAPYYVYTLANQAGQPTVTNPTDHTLDVTIDPNGNPYFTHCAIYVDSWGGSVDEYYLNASGGSNGSTPFWQSIADWGTVTATGLDSGIQYGFSARARNGDGIETGWSSFGLGTTTSTPTDTVGASLSCVPSSGTVPFTTQMTMTLQNLYTEQIRRVAGRLHVTLAGGTYFANWRGGYTNIDAGGSYVTSWNTTIPALGSLIGSNHFQLVAVDVTPVPYNQPPYPAAGDSDTSACTVVANSP